ncbi:hypothetical protein FQN57_005135 [Myotisia sp. PD_48]|nr:hypothetical protein FQN57_005135 [Myotisia sp. PD_48]
MNLNNKRDFTGLTPSTVLRSQILSQFSGADSAKLLLSKFVQFFSQGNLDDSLSLLRYLLAQLTTPSQPSRPTSPSSHISQSLSSSPHPSVNHQHQHLQIEIWRPHTPSSSPPSLLACPSPPQIFSFSREERLDRIDSIARKYFTQKGIYDTERLNRLVTASVQFVKSKPLSPEKYQNIWNYESKVFPDNVGSRVDRLESAKRNIDGGQKLIGCASRLILLFLIHEINEKKNLPRPPGCKASTYALSEYAKEAKRSTKSINNDLSEGRHFLTILDNVGPGDLIRLDANNIQLWTRRLRDSDISLVLEFQKVEFPPHDEDASRYNEVGARVIVDGLRGCGWNYNELACCRGRVMQALFKYIDKEALKTGTIRLKQSNSEITGGSRNGANATAHTTSHSLNSVQDAAEGLARLRQIRTSRTAAAVPGSQALVHHKDLSSRAGYIDNATARKRQFQENVLQSSDIHPSRRQKNNEQHSGSNLNSVDEVQPIRNNEVSDSQKDLYEPLISSQNFGINPAALNKSAIPITTSPNLVVIAENRADLEDPLIAGSYPNSPTIQSHCFNPEYHNLNLFSDMEHHNLNLLSDMEHHNLNLLSDMEHHNLNLLSDMEHYNLNLFNDLEHHNLNTSSNLES